MSEWLAATASAFVLIFFAEFGDKTQLALVAISRPGRRLSLWVGATLGFALLSALAVLAGDLVQRWVDWHVVAVLTGLVFVALGLRSLKDSKSDVQAPILLASPWAALSLILATELGDKSQLGTAALAANGQSALAYGVGATVALSLNAALAIAAGAWIASRVPSRRLAKVSGVVFILLGMASLVWGLMTAVTSA